MCGAESKWFHHSLFPNMSSLVWSRLLHTVTVFTLRWRIRLKLCGRSGHDTRQFLQSCKRTARTSLTKWNWFTTAHHSNYLVKYKVYIGCCNIWSQYRVHQPWYEAKPSGLGSRLERDVAQSIACPPLKRSVVGSILLSGPSCSLGYFPFQPVVHNWFIKGCGMYCSVYGKVHIKDPLLLIEKSSLCGGSGFPSKKCVNVTIWMTSNNRW